MWKKGHASKPTSKRNIRNHMGVRQRFNCRIRYHDHANFTIYIAECRWLWASHDYFTNSLSNMLCPLHCFFVPACFVSKTAHSCQPAEQPSCPSKYLINSDGSPRIVTCVSPMLSHSDIIAPVRLVHVTLSTGESYTLPTESRLIRLDMLDRGLMWLWKSMNNSLGSLGLTWGIANLACLLAISVSQLTVEAVDTLTVAKT